jgi:cell division protein FtsQ
MIAAAIQRLRVESVRDVLAAAAPGPRGRRILIVLISVALVLAAGYLLWLRNSSLVRVENVTVTGLTGDDADRIRSALEGAARQSTTLRVDEDAIEGVAETFPTIRAIEIQPDFPNSMHIRVLQHRPAALLVGRGKRIPVAGDGSVLSGLRVKGSLPTIELKGALPVQQLDAGPMLDAARVAGGAPVALTPRVDQITREKRRGIVVRMESGPELVFGTVARVTAKWAAATRVLADRDATGADYVDVRIPERPVAGGLPVSTLAPLAPAGEQGPAAPISPEHRTPQAAGAAATAAPSGPQAAGGQSPPEAGTPQGAQPGATQGPEPDGPSPVSGTGGGAGANPQP